MRQRRFEIAVLRLACAAVVVCLVSHAPAFGDERVTGTKVSLSPPPGFVAETKFPGFGKPASSASIMVTEVPAPIGELVAGLTKTGLAGRGMTLHESTQTKVDGRDGQLLRVTQSAAGVSFEKWIVAFGTGSESVFIVATYPESEAKSLREPMKSAVLSARWNLAAEIDRFEGLPFRVTETAGLKIAKRVSNLLILTEGGVEEIVAPENPLLVVGASINDVDLSDLKAFSEERLRRTEQVAGVKNLQGSATKVDGLDAYELTADASDVKSSKPIRLYQLVIADGGSYFLAQGLVGAKRAGEFLGQFHDVATSIRRNR